MTTMMRRISRKRKKSLNPSQKRKRNKKMTRKIRRIKSLNRKTISINQHRNNAIKWAYDS